MHPEGHFCVLIFANGQLSNSMNSIDTKLSGNFSNIMQMFNQITFIHLLRACQTKVALFPACVELLRGGKTQRDWAGKTGEPLFYSQPPHTKTERIVSRTESCSYILLRRQNPPAQLWLNAEYSVVDGESSVTPHFDKFFLFFFNIFFWCSETSCMEF